MFKKGQLVRSDLSRSFYLVLAWPDSLELNTGQIVRLNTYGIWELIGNNYQAKPKCSR